MPLPLYLPATSAPLYVAAEADVDGMAPRTVQALGACLRRLPAGVMTCAEEPHYCCVTIRLFGSVFQNHTRSNSLAAAATATDNGALQLQKQSSLQISLLLQPLLHLLLLVATVILAVMPSLPRRHLLLLHRRRHRNTVRNCRLQKKWSQEVEGKPLKRAAGGYERSKLADRARHEAETGGSVVPGH